MIHYSGIIPDTSTIFNTKKAYVFHTCLSTNLFSFVWRLPRPSLHSLLFCPTSPYCPFNNFLSAICPSQQTDSNPKATPGPFPCRLPTPATAFFVLQSRLAWTWIISTDLRFQYTLYFYNPNQQALRNLTSPL